MYVTNTVSVNRELTLYEIKPNDVGGDDGDKMRVNSCVISISVCM